MNFAPIALFVYNRPWHTKQTVEALKKNDLSSESLLFIFSDGPKDGMSINAVQEVRNYIKTIKGFKDIQIIERTSNFGLAKSIISGVTEVISKYGKIIVLEDDLISSTNFLLFINSALSFYANEKKIFSVSGFNFPMEIPFYYKFDGFCSYRHISWGWGTWQDRWEKADWDVGDCPEFRFDKKAQKKFNRGGDDLSDMLFAQLEGKIDSWAIKWLYTLYKHNAFSFCPVKSKIFNIGFDNSGINCGANVVDQQDIVDENDKQFVFPKELIIDEYFINTIREIHKYNFKKKVKTYIQKTIS